MKRALIFSFILLVFAAALIITLPRYGMNEDSPGHFLRGQAYLELILTGKRSFEQPTLSSPVYFVPGQRISLYKLNAWENTLSPIRPIEQAPGGSTIQERYARYQAAAGRQSMYKHNSWNAGYFLANDGEGHPAVGDIISAGFNRLFFERLGLFSDVDAYHLFAISAALMALAMVYWFTQAHWGTLAAVLAAATLGLYPWFFAESHFNIKDIPVLAFWTVSTIGFTQWVLTGRVKYFVLMIFSVFLSLGTKLNILFLPVVFLLWLIITNRSPVSSGWKSFRLIIYGAVGLCVPIALLVASWPFLWDAPVQKLVSLVRFYMNVGSVDRSIQETTQLMIAGSVNVRGALLALSSAPVIVILFVFVGSIATLATIIRRRQGEESQKDAAAAMVLLWLLVPIARTLMPGADVFGSIRQFAEFVPAAAILSGIGFITITRRIRSRFVVIVVMGIFITILLIPILQLHPNENMYVNPLFGGIKAAQESGIIGWQTTYDNPYRAAVNWLNAHAPEGARLAYIDGTMLGIFPGWLRSDIQFGSHFSGISQEGEYVISIVYPRPPGVFPYLYMDRFLTPVHEIRAGDAVIAKIWKNDSLHLRPEFAHARTLSGPFDKKTGYDDTFGRYWEIAVESGKPVVALTLTINPEKCEDRDGIFWLNDYMIPLEEREGNDITYIFPAEPAETVRWYELVGNSCVYNGTITSVSVLGK